MSSDDEMEVTPSGAARLAGICAALGWTWLPGVRPFTGVTVDKKDAIRFAVFATILFTAVFYAPSLASGYMADDHFHVFALGEFPGAFRQWNLFGLISGGDEVRVLRENGILPWWTSDAMRIDFWRPIPSFLMQLDWMVFGRNPAATHLVSIAWYVLSIYVFYRVMTRFIPEGSRTLLLAVAIFALDDCHALNVQWIASRNDLVASVFLLSGFLAYLQVREGAPRSRGLALVVLCYVLGLLSKESSIVLPALILAHALFLPESDDMGLRARLRPWVGLLAVLGVVAVAYLIFWVKSGHGPNTLFYIHPLRNPGVWAGHFFRSGFFHAVILATGVPLHVLSDSPARDFPIPVAICVVLTIAFWVSAAWLLRRDRQARFFVAWMLIGQLIATTAFPDPRLLYLPSIGFAYVCAKVFAETWKLRHEWRPARPLLATLVLLHFVFAPLLEQVSFYVVRSFQDGYDKVAAGVKSTVDYDNLPDEGTEVFFLNWHQRESSVLANLYLTLNLPKGADVGPLLNAPGTYTEKIERGFSAVKIHYYSLSILNGEVDAHVVDDHTITLAPKQGQYFPGLFEQLYMTSLDHQVGQTVKLGAFEATIDATNDAGEVTRVRFTFPKPLSSSTYRFMAWDGTKFAPVNLAELVGGKLALRVEP